jgi:hypothetical protein
MILHNLARVRLAVKEKMKILNFTKFAFLLVFVVVYGSRGDKSHPHHGILQSFDGKPIHISLSLEQQEQLQSGDAVSPVASKFVFHYRLISRSYLKNE